MKKATWPALLLGLAFFVASCSLFAPESGEARSQEIVFQTDQDHYEATVTAGRVPHVEITIPVVYRNTTDTYVYLIGCRTPFRPVLEKRVDRKWVSAWVPVEDACLSPPWPIGPGETFRDTVRVFGVRPGYNAAPTFDTEVPGTYRLVQRLYVDPEGEQALPPIMSNTFRVTQR